PLCPTRRSSDLQERTLLFVDEIHRFNRAQQDAFLPYVESGTVTLVGATTENPSFELNGALLSRAQVIVLNRLGENDLAEIVARAEKLMGKKLNVTNDARAWLLQQVDGDGRYLLNLVEILLHQKTAAPLDVAQLQNLLQKRAPLYDKGQEAHYNLISALHKSVRGSDVNAALYWLARMIAGGEDPNFIARRVVRMAYEDIGLADPSAALQAIAAWQTFERLGPPEGELALAQAVVYLATAPKSIGVYQAWGNARRAAQETGSLAPPAYAMNAPTKMMKDLGYADGYIYDPDTPEGFSGLNYFPPQMKRQELYTPIERGFEREIKKRLEYWEKLRAAKN
ncbi:MAG TPA: AAA family ATPase, partial [Rhodospirillaceae bacterium]|nr:AAA family ATPase [Rhodospirillaceae bacterium]